MAQALATRHGFDALAHAEKRWPGDSPTTIRRDAVSGATSSDWSVSAQPAELLQASVAESVIGRLGVREVPMRVPVLAPDGALTGAWVGESKAIPAGRIAVAATTLTPRKCGVIVPVTAETLESGDARAERVIERDVRRALVAALDEALLDPANDGTGDRPVAITNTAPSVASTGDPVADLLALAAAFPGTLSRAAIVTDPQTALALSLWTDTGGAVRFLDAGPRGGVLATMPLIVSDYSPRDSSGGVLVMVDAEGVAAAIDDVQFTVTAETLIEQNSAPQGAADTPTAASATLISTFQNELIAVKGVIRCNWARMLPCVAVCTSALYA